MPKHVSSASISDFAIGGNRTLRVRVRVRASTSRVRARVRVRSVVAEKGNQEGEAGTRVGLGLW